MHIGGTLRGQQLRKGVAASAAHDSAAWHAWRVADFQSEISKSSNRSKSSKRILVNYYLVTPFYYLVGFQCFRNTSQVVKAMV